MDSQTLWAALGVIVAIVALFFQLIGQVNPENLVIKAVNGGLVGGFIGILISGEWIGLDIVLRTITQDQEIIGFRSDVAITYAIFTTIIGVIGGVTGTMIGTAMNTKKTEIWGAIIGAIIGIVIVRIVFFIR